ncbi:MAG: cysteine-rich CWC family protein [Pseudomonas balearica]|uniref:cysteine-rich CWC family protein n=1 Tax=Stutzerimonas balearica TaxID=74829 RepID=UPI0019B505D3|nr:cysteine-rich CWC family protein [Stutzerimonas balearica]
MQILKSLEARQGTHPCPACSAPVRCDIEAGKSTCWCFGVQAKEQEHGDVCHCRRCLTKR